MSTATKKELEDQIKELKTRLKEYMGLAEERDTLKSATLSELPNTAVGLFRNEKGLYKRVLLKYCPKSNQAVIESIEDASRLPEDRLMAQFEIEDLLHNRVFKEIV